MKFTTLLVTYLTFALSLIFITGPTLVIGQQSTIVSTDTTSPEIEIIKLSEISIKSGEVWMESSRLYESLISNEDITKMKTTNDSLVKHIDSLLKKELLVDLNTKNIRYLNNKRVYWKKFADILDVEETALSLKIETLNEYKHNFEDEILIWEKTKIAINEEDADPTVINRVVKLISQLSGLANNIQNKNDVLLTMLDKTTKEEVKLVVHIDRIDKELINKKSEVFFQDQPPFYLVLFSDSSNWNLIEPLVFFYKIEVIQLIKYYDDYFTYLVFQLFLIIVLIFGFSAIKRRLNNTDIHTDTIYVQMLRKIFSRNISAALIMGIFASVLIFPNRPELFKDIIVLLIIIPLIIIVTKLIDKWFFKYIYLFGVVVYLGFIYTIYPPDNLYSTVSMILVAIIEIFVLWQLTSYFYKHPFSRKFLSNLLILLIIINLGFAIIGLLAVLYGATILATMSLQVPITNIISGVLVTVTASIINGLIDVGIQSPYFKNVNFIQLYGSYLRQKTIRLINTIAVLFWISTMLTTLNIKKIIITEVTDFFTNNINVGSASFTLWDITIFFLVIWLSIVIAKMIRVLLEEDILKKMHLGKGVPHTIAMMVRYSIITLGVLLAITAAGVPVNNLTVLFGAFGVGIGFGLQNIFNNIVSGFILLFERPIQIGDTIEVGQLQLTGIVKSIGIRSSNVRTFDGAEVIVPNGQLISNEVVNWTLSDRRRRIEIITGVAYGSDTYKVKDLLNKILNEHPKVINDPKPIVLFVEMAESSLNFRMLFWTADSSNWIDIRSEVMFSIYDVLTKEGITIPFPQMDVHLQPTEKGDNTKSS